MDHDELMAMATETICELNTLTDAQAQELQNVWGEIERLEEENARQRGVWDALAEMTIDRNILQTEIKRLREALEPFAELHRTIEKHQSIPADYVMIWGDLIGAAATLEAK